MAGHETTAATLTWAWYLLANAPWAEEAMLAEIAQVCGTRAPTIADVPALDWCRSIIEETLRLYPPVAFLARQAKDKDELFGIAVEPAALMIVSPWLMHRTEGIWDRPNHFLPERFLGKERPAPFTYLAFSVGPRICPGLNFGLTEAILCLASLAQRFAIRPLSGHKVEPVCRLTVRPLGGMPATAKTR
jgi:cytochrome P450